MRLAEAVELLFEDETQEPFSMHLSVESFDMLPAKPLSVIDRSRPH